MYLRPKNPVREDRIASLKGDVFSLLAVTSEPSPFPGCTRHTITIGRDDYRKDLVIHAQGVAPEVGASCKRMRIGGNGIALIWGNVSGRASGGGFTSAAVPPDWRGLKNPVPAPSRGRDAPVGKPLPERAL